MAEVKDHYNAEAENYNWQYEKESLNNLNQPYPANYFRMQLMINSFLNKDVKKIMEVGLGNGTPLLQLYKAGFDVSGFDISHSMVDKAKETFKKFDSQYDENKIFYADIQDANTYVGALKDGKYDGLMAMGVMPHVQNDDLVMKNINSMLKPNGHVFIEFRNKLFSLFTFNKNTVDFITNDLLKNVNKNVVSVVKEDLESRVRMDQPKKREKLSDGSPAYDAILSKFHNPMEISSLFERNGFKNIKLHWYHYHPAMPYLNEKMPELFRQESINLEHESSDWRGYFLCSAFVVEATKC